MRALFIVNGRDGCSWYRVKQPGQMLHETELCEVHLQEKGHGVDVFAHAFAWAEVVFMGRVGGQAMLRMVRNLHDEGKAVVIDLDDDVLNVSPLSEHYRIGGLKKSLFRWTANSSPYGWISKRPMNSKILILGDLSIWNITRPTPVI